MRSGIEIRYRDPYKAPIKHERILIRLLNRNIFRSFKMLIREYLFEFIWQIILEYKTHTNFSHSEVLKFLSPIYFSNLSITDYPT